MKVTIEFTFPTEDDYFEFMSALEDDNLEYLRFKCKTIKKEE